MTLYSTNCPLCKVLKTKLDEKKYTYTIISDEQTIIEKGFMSVPILEIDDLIMTYNEAIKWLNKGDNA